MVFYMVHHLGMIMLFFASGFRRIMSFLTLTRYVRQSVLVFEAAVVS